MPKILGTQYCFGQKIITSTKITMNKNDNHNHNFDGFWHNLNLPSSTSFFVVAGLWIWFYTKIAFYTITHPSPPPTHHHWESNISLTQFWPDLNGRFLGTSRTDSNSHHSRWHLSRQFLSWLHLSISDISQLLLSQFWPDFKGTDVMVTRVHTTFVNISNISTVNYRFAPIYYLLLWTQDFLWPNFFSLICFGPK